MKVDKLKKELTQMSGSDLAELLDALRRERFSLSLNISTTHNKDYSLFKKLRKDIARVQTVRNQAAKRI
jgi:ribosomal protein L29